MKYEKIPHIMFKPPRSSFYDGEPVAQRPDGLHLRRKFVEWTSVVNGIRVEVLPQVWVCPKTGAEVMDDRQQHCLQKAAELAATAEGEVLYYHTRAWREND